MYCIMAMRTFTSADTTTSFIYGFQRKKKYQRWKMKTHRWLRMLTSAGQTHLQLQWRILTGDGYCENTQAHRSRKRYDLKCGQESSRSEVGKTSTSGAQLLWEPQRRKRKDFEHATKRSTRIGGRSALHLECLAALGAATAENKNTTTSDQT